MRVVMLTVVVSEMLAAIVLVKSERWQYSKCYGAVVGSRGVVVAVE